VEAQDEFVQRSAADDMVPAAQSIRLAEALTSGGAEVELELVPRASHFWNGAEDVAAIVRRSVDFLRGHG
jgi:dipeptidyl aminopeptidase/acylaminoacyl peptidase